jgi:hypothetical protein
VAPFLLSRADDGHDISGAQTFVVRLCIIVAGSVLFGFDDQQVLGSELVFVKSTSKTACVDWGQDRVRDDLIHRSWAARSYYLVEL